MKNTTLGQPASTSVSLLAGMQSHPAAQTQRTSIRFTEHHSAPTRRWEAEVDGDQYLVITLPYDGSGKLLEKPYQLTRNSEVMDCYPSSIHAMFGAMVRANHRAGWAAHTLTLPAITPAEAEEEAAADEERADSELDLHRRMADIVDHCFRSVCRIQMPPEASTAVYHALVPAGVAIGAIREVMPTSARIQALDRMEEVIAQRKQQAGGCENCDGPLGLDSCKGGCVYVSVLRCSNCGHVQPIPEGSGNG